jgi:hypothetical protein
MAVNQALDAQGFWTAQQAAFNLQHLGHTHARVLGLMEQLKAAQQQATEERAETASN